MDGTEQLLVAHIQFNLTGGFDNDTSKSMVEQEILYWVDENNQPVEIETKLFDFLNSLN